MLECCREEMGQSDWTKRCSIITAQCEVGVGGCSFVALLPTLYRQAAAAVVLLLLLLCGCRCGCWWCCCVAAAGSTAVAERFTGAERG